MALIGMAIYSTEENGKDECLRQTLQSLKRTVDFSKHRIMFSVNAYTEKTGVLLDAFSEHLNYQGISPAGTIINKENIGTAEAINKVWRYRFPNEHVVKMDDDIVIAQVGWLDDMEEAIRRDPLIGQIGLKRKDCWENPQHTEADYKSELIMLPQVAGESWLIVEKVKHVIGSCVMHSSALIDKVGALYQPSLYGYDDVIMSHRSYIAGFYSCFLPSYKIDHIDNGTTPYQPWKEKHAGEQTQTVIDLVHHMRKGEADIFYPFK